MRERCLDYYDYVRKYDVEWEFGDEFLDDIEYCKIKSGRIECRKVFDRVVVENCYFCKFYFFNDDDVIFFDEFKI